MPTRDDADALIQDIMRIAKDQGLSGLALAHAANISYSALSRNATGRGSPRLTAIRALLRVIGYDIKLVPIAREKSSNHTYG